MRPRKCMGIIILFSAVLMISSASANEAARKAAERVLGIHESERMQKAITTQKQRIQKKHLIPENESIAHEMQETIAPAEIFVFVSSSMPTAVLQEFAEDSFSLHTDNVAHTVFVLQGYPQEGLKTFGRRMNPDDNGLTIRVDPFLFGKLEIDTVPIVIVDRKYVVLHPQSLATAIKKINEKGAGYDDLVQSLNI